jgi:glycosyltransferase involved in cell wall biosynthesis
MDKLTREPPQIAVITPYYDEDLNLLEQCHHSVLEQTLPCLHVLVADGKPKAAIDRWDAHHIVLPVSHADIGSTPRLIGSYHAIGLGVDAVTFLDADNWYEPEHLANLMAARLSHGAAFVSSGRMLCQLDGSPMGPCPLTNPDRFIDTNCMLFGRDAFPLLHHWVLMPGYGHLIGDRIMLHRVKESGVQRVHMPNPSVNYRSGKAGLYRLMNRPVPEGVQSRPDYEASFQKWIADGNAPLN